MVHRTHPATRRSLSFLVLLFVLAGGGLVGCQEAEVSEEPRRIDPGDPIERDLSDIRERDTLVVLAHYNSTGYFLYRGQPRGFEYELLQDFADELDLPMKTVVIENKDSLFYYLNQGRGDIAAARLIPLGLDTVDAAFTEALYETKPAVVQQEDTVAESDMPARVDSLLVRGAPSDSLPSMEVSARLIQRPEQLAGEEVYIPGASAYFDTLVELSDSLTGDIEVVELEGDISYETLIRQVSRGEVSLTVSPTNLAKLKESYFTNIIVTPTLGPQHEVSWAVRQNATALLDTLNTWLSAQRGTSDYQTLYDRYFVDRQGYQERLDDEYLTSETGRLSEYDELFREYAPNIDWDWRLLASQTFQESRFKPRAKSWAGAMGLLQLMPATAREFGVSNPYDPDANVAGATRFLEWQMNYWDDKITDPNERLRFILASYNTGHGHVQDARRLTEKYGDNPDVWADVSYWLLQKSKKRYYQDPVVKYGYCRGLEPVLYVSHILDRYDHYRQFVPDELVPTDSTQVASL